MGAERAAEQTDVKKKQGELQRLEEQALALLATLDELQFHQAAAYLSMAVDAIRRQSPDPDWSG